MPNRNNVTLSSLPPEGRGLVALMQYMNFGRIEELKVLKGLPVLNPVPRLFREIKLGGENGPHAKGALGEFLVRAEVRELLGVLTQMGEGVILLIEVRYGLPVKMVYEECGMPQLNYN